jgi:hypothetical protein
LGIRARVSAVNASLSFEDIADKRGVAIGAREAISRGVF